MRACALVLITLTLPSLPAWGAEAPTQQSLQPETEITVSIQIRGNAPPTLKSPAKASATWFGKGTLAPVSFDLSTSKPATLKLRPGRWILQADAPGFWSSPFQLELGDRAAQAALDLWPAGRIEGEFLLEKGSDPPSDVALFFRPAPDVPATAAPPPAKVVCPIKENAWACSLPAGVMDLRVQVDGLVPRYLWGIRLEPGRTLRPGRVELRGGSAVLGWVITADGSGIGDKATVELRPRLAGPTRGSDTRERLESLSFQAPVNSRGFFQLDGIPPGAYILEARHERFASAITTVRVLAGEVTEIANPPLLLNLPRAIEAFITPPTDPAGKPWSVKLQRFDRDTSRVTTLTTETASADGSWRKAGFRRASIS